MPNYFEGFAHFKGNDVLALVLIVIVFLIILLGTLVIRANMKKREPKYREAPKVQIKDGVVSIANEQKPVVSTVIDNSTRILEIENELNAKRKGKITKEWWSHRKELTTELNALKSSSQPPPSSIDTPSLVGTGIYRAYAFRDGALEPTVIPVPVGNLFNADVSMPVSGPCYLVKELPDKRIVAYNPFGTPLVMEETPQMAYFATHWDIVVQWYKSQTPFWQQATFWIVVALIALAFILGIVFYG